ncbi:MAG: nucleotidyltransferase domain-containing protein [Clostridia bacterium]|nr:nucleotidyltransferase domain-containing protein [Clostridia bacterium]MCI9275149.1 nucleotidyltransferase domain-containing protein [Clostridia bacterium]
MKETIDKIKEIIIEELNCEAIVLFGSYSRNTQNEESDIDIAFKSKREISKKEIFYLKQELEEVAKKEIDLINLDDIGDAFRYEILINGNTLYCENELKFELYKLDMYREFLELNEGRMSIIERIKKGDTIYGE